MLRFECCASPSKATVTCAGPVGVSSSDLTVNSKGAAACLWTASPQQTEPDGVSRPRNGDARIIARAGKRWQQHRRQDGNDGDHHEEFNQGKLHPPVFHGHPPLVSHIADHYHLPGNTTKLPPAAPGRNTVLARGMSVLRKRARLRFGSVSRLQAVLGGDSGFRPAGGPACGRKAGTPNQVGPPTGDSRRERRS